MDEIVGKLVKQDAWTTDAVLEMLGYTSGPFVQKKPPPTPSLDILRRFAKVAGWSVTRSSVGTPLSGPIPGPDCFRHDDYARNWLDSECALDAAAIVAVRKGGGLSWRFSLGGGCMAYIFDVSAPHHSGIPPQAIASAGATYAGRAGVRACLAAFEEKPA